MPNLTVNDILTDAYEEASATPEYKASNTLGLKHLHLIVQEVWQKATKLKKNNCNWDIWLADTVSLQDEYTKPSVSSTTVWAQHIETLSVCYTDKTYTETGNKIYIPCKSAMDHEIANWEYYLEHQDRENPIFFQRDKSVFIAPDPRSDEVWVGRLKVTGIRSIDSGSWTSSTTEDAMKLPLSLFDSLKLGLVWKINAYLRRDRNVIIDSKNEYLASSDSAIANMFTEEPFINEFPR